LPFVERLAKREARTEGQKSIQEAAQTVCLFAGALRTEARPADLLRASSVAETGSATLLRSMTEPVPTDPDQLLRAGDPCPGQPRQISAFDKSKMPIRTD